LNICSPGVTKSYLKRTAIIGVVRLAITLVMSVSWFALANHCELAAAVVSLQGQSHSCCKKDKEAETSPAKENPQSGSECCKTVHPVVVSASKKPVSPGLSFTPNSFFVAAVLFPDLPRLTTIAELDTGPPFVSSFAEAVLQRSLLAHAPPCLI
jgi:hypothetical protein